MGGEGNNGTDMIFNPGRTVIYNTGTGYIAGGGHYIYIMGHRDLYKDKGVNSYEYEEATSNRICPAYDNRAWL